MKLIIASLLFALSLGEEILIQTEPPPKPYAFGYAAGRYPGHIDRTHSEISDGLGTVQGSYSYVDPRHKIRTVDYVADKFGFHPISNDNVPALPSDTPVVAAAKVKHLQKYSAIANSHQSQPNQVIVPSDTLAVQYAKSKHFALFEKIANEHAKLAAEAELRQNQEIVHDDGKYGHIIVQ